MSELNFCVHCEERVVKVEGRGWEHTPSMLTYCAHRANYPATPIEVAIERNKELRRGVLGVRP